MPLFRLLHASDLHFYRTDTVIGLTEFLPALARGAVGRPHWVSGHAFDLADALAEFAYRNRDGYDVIVLSGDLAATGTPLDLAVAHHFITAPAVQAWRSAAGFPTLAAAGKSVVLIPGNHDRYGPAWTFFSPGDTQFDRRFGATHWHAGQGVQRLWVGQRDEDTLVLIGADLTLASGDSGDWAGLGHLGRGRAYPARLQSLLQATQDARAEYLGCAVVWVIHFEPEAHDTLLALLDEHQLARALGSADVAGVLCGHTHLSCHAKTFAAATFFVCGTSTQRYAPSGNWLQIIDVEVNPESAHPVALHFYPHPLP